MRWRSTALTELWTIWSEGRRGAGGAGMEWNRMAMDLNVCRGEEMGVVWAFGFPTTQSVTTDLIEYAC